MNPSEQTHAALKEIIYATALKLRELGCHAITICIDHPDPGVIPLRISAGEAPAIIGLLEVEKIRIAAELSVRYEKEVKTRIRKEAKKNKPEVE